MRADAASAAIRSTTPIRLVSSILAIALAGCAPARGGPRPIVAGTPCAACGMPIKDLRYACEGERAGRYRAYDSIECLLRADPPPARAWLADYDTRALHVSDSIWVIRADIPSPMGGGYAAFLDRAAAGEIAASRNGRVARLLDFASGVAERDSLGDGGGRVPGVGAVPHDSAAGPS